jgi:hypothetical protein
MMLGSGLGVGLDDAGPAGSEPAGWELDGVDFEGLVALLLGRGVGALEPLDELPVDGPPGEPAAEVAGGCCAGGLSEGLAGTELEVAELLGAGEVGGWDTVAVGVRDGVLGTGRDEVGVPGALVGTLGLGRAGVEDPGWPVLAQLSRMLPELTTAPSRPITRTSYLAGVVTTWLKVRTEALGWSKLIRVPTGSAPASRPSWRTSSTV